MPSYKNTKPVTADKIKKQADEEIAYQKSYARRRHGEETAGTGPSTKHKGEKARRKASYERVDPSLRGKSKSGPGSYASIAGETLSEVRRLAKKVKERYGEFQDIPARMKK